MITAKLEHADGHEITPRDWMHLRICPIPGSLVAFAGPERHVYRVLNCTHLEIPYSSSLPDKPTIDVILRVRHEP